MTVVTHPEAHGVVQAISRRRLLKVGFFAGLGVLFAGAAAGLTRFLYANRTLPHAYVQVGSFQIPRVGDPPFLDQAKSFYLVNLAPDEGLWNDWPRANPDHSTGGLLALSTKCPHLGCHVQWDATSQYAVQFGGAVGLFDCPCHGSKFSKAGVKVFGPSPRSLDTMRIQVLPSGDLHVHTTDKQTGTAPFSPPDPTAFVPAPPER